MQNNSAGRLLPAPSRADRRIARASKGHCTAYAVVGDGPGRRMQAESHLELTHLQMLDADPAIVDLQEQVLFSFGEGDRRRHFFDLVATFNKGSRIAFTIKPEARLRSGRFLDEMREVAWWVRKKSFADDVRLLTDADVDPVALHNAKVLAAVRQTDPEADALARRMTEDLIGGTTLRELTRATGMEARGYRALLRLIRTGALIPSANERINPQTLVLSKGAIR